MMEDRHKMKVKSGSFLEVFNYKDLLNQLVSRDIKLKYRRSFLGYVWSILNPLLVMIVMVIVFSKMFDRKIPHFPVYLFAGRILYEFVIGSCGKALGSITDNSALLKKTYVSKFMFPLAKITSSLVDCLFSLGAFLLVIIFTRSPFYLNHAPVSNSVLSGLSVCLRNGIFPCTASCIFQGYKIYMECHNHYVDVLFGYILSDQYAS